MSTFIVTLGTEITRQYAGHNVTFSINRLVEVTTNADIDREYSKLLQVLDRQHELFIAEKLPELRGAPDYKSPDAHISRYNVEKFVLSIDKGKKLIKAITKEAVYSTWGVPIYDEVAEAHGLPAIMGQALDFPVEGVTVTVDESGKYKKVIKIEGLG